MKNNNICNGKFINNIDIQELENSMLVIAKKKILVESSEALSSYQDQPVIGEEYGRDSLRLFFLGTEWR